MSNQLDLTVIILTFNEEKNIEECLASVSPVNANIFVVDSFSTDRTLEILEERGVSYVQHPFENYSAQRNWAQYNIPTPTEWVLHLDAGERLSQELQYWINNHFSPNSNENGYMFSRRTIFLDRWIRYGGHYPNFHLRLFRRLKGGCEQKVYDQHFLVDGPTKAIAQNRDIIDYAADDLKSFTEKHAKWALYEAFEICLPLENSRDEVQARFSGSPIERMRWLKSNLFQKTPIFLRPTLYFFYRFFIRLGFLDGKPGLVFHVLQGFWFRYLVDCMVFEIRAELAKGWSLVEIAQKKYQLDLVKVFGEKVYSHQ